jgi:ribosomal protein S18 acetylase RimI-like enzyme
LIVGSLELSEMSAHRVALVEYADAWLDELIPMWRASFENGVGIVEPHPIEDQKRYFLTQVLPTHAVRLAFEDAKLVGFVAASRESIAQLYVRIGFQRQGIGTYLLDWAKEQSMGQLWLFTFARNQRACSFYEKNGFVAIARGFEPLWQLEDVKYQWTARRPAVQRSPGHCAGRAR